MNGWQILGWAALIACATFIMAWGLVFKPRLEDLQQRIAILTDALTEARAKNDDEAIVKLIPTRDDWDDLTDFLPQDR